MRYAKDEAPIVRHHGRARQAPRTPHKTTTEGHTMKALTLAALLILGSTTAYASNLSKWQALQKKYGPDGHSVSLFEALDKAKFLCLCYDQGLTNALGFFTPFTEENTQSLGKAAKYRRTSIVTDPVRYQGLPNVPLAREVVTSPRADSSTEVVSAILPPQHHGRSCQTPRTPQKTPTEGHTMKALTLAALLILGSTTAYASNLTKWQALLKKYGPNGMVTSTAEQLDKAKYLCLCYDAGTLNNALGFFTAFDRGPAEPRRGKPAQCLGPSPVLMGSFNFIRNPVRHSTSSRDSDQSADR